MLHAKRIIVSARSSNNLPASAVHLCPLHADPSRCVRSPRQQTCEMWPLQLWNAPTVLTPASLPLRSGENGLPACGYPHASVGPLRRKGENALCVMSGSSHQLELRAKAIVVVRKKLLPRREARVKTCASRCGEDSLAPVCPFVNREQDRRGRYQAEEASSDTSKRIQWAEGDHRGCP